MKRNSNAVVSSTRIRAHGACWLVPLVQLKETTNSTKFVEECVLYAAWGVCLSISIFKVRFCWLTMLYAILLVPRQIKAGSTVAYSSNSEWPLRNVGFSFKNEQVLCRNTLVEIVLVGWPTFYLLIGTVYLHQRRFELHCFTSKTAVFVNPFRQAHYQIFVHHPLFNNMRIRFLKRWILKMDQIKIPLDLQMELHKIGSTIGPIIMHLTSASARANLQHEPIWFSTISAQAKYLYY